MIVLANDGITGPGKEMLEEAGFEVRNLRVAQEQLANYINNEKVSVLLVRSATRVDRDLITSCPGLLLVGRAGVGLDNIDATALKKKGVHLINTPKASAESVAELVFAHLLGGARFLHQANREMPLEGESQFRSLKKAYSTGRELRGKKLGVIGFGSIGQAVAKRALAWGMEVGYCDPGKPETSLELSFAGGQAIGVGLKHADLKTVLASSDFVSLHTPAQEDYLIGKKELGLMKKGGALINTARGGLVDEAALLEALDTGHLSFAALDVFEAEPAPPVALLMHPALSLSPHIGASTREAQDRIGVELAEQIIKLLNNPGGRA